MLENLGETPSSFILRAELKEDPEEVGARLRSALGITRERQAQWHLQGYDAFNEVRDAVEACGALVFQAAVPLSEMRGLALYREPLPIVIVSSKEQFMAPRLFTLLHEVSHLMLHCSAVSNGAEEGLHGEAQMVEVFANHVAGAALMPLDALLTESGACGNTTQHSVGRRADRACVPPLPREQGNGASTLVDRRTCHAQSLSHRR